MSRRSDRGRPVSDKAFREAERVMNLHPLQQRHHPSAVPTDHGKLDHINTHGPLPEFYLDQPFLCRTCGRREIWRAADQKWYFEEAKGHISARAVECRACRQAGKIGNAHEQDRP